jgi:Tfp pilus assembly protein PilO
MTLQDLVEKLRRFPVPTTCGAIVLVCFFAFYLRMDLITDLDIENDDVQRQVQQVEQNLTHGRTLEKHIAEMDAKVAEFNLRVIKPAELANNLKYFYEIEATTRVSIADLRQNVNTPAKGASKTILANVDYSVLVTGRFDQVLSYLNELEHGRHFYRLDGFNLQRGRQEGAPSDPTGPGPVTMSLNLQLLGWP